MAHLKELRQKRIDILKKICDNQTLCKLLYYNEDNPLSMPDITDSFDKLIMNRLFPLPFIPSITNNTGAYLCIYFGDIRKDGMQFKDIQIKFVVLCHKDSWIIADNQLRPDNICEAIEDEFNMASDMGIGRVLFDYRRPIQINDTYFGYEMSYRVYDFN
jgi:hypothetical protein